MLGEIPAASWSEFGLPGLVIGALFAMLLWLGGSIRSYLSSERESHRQERTEILTRFDSALKRNEERSTEASRKLGDSIDELARAIREMKHLS